MPRKIALVFLLVLLSMRAIAQADACAIFIYNNGGDALTMDVYALPDGAGAAEAISSLLLPAADSLVVSTASGNLHVAAGHLAADERSVRLDFYKITPAALNFEPQANLTAIRPRPHGWSANGLYLALRDAGGGLAVYDTGRGDIFQPLPDVEIDTAVWSPLGATIAFAARDSASGFAVYATEPDGTPLYVYPLDEATFARLGWLSGTQIAVTECAGDACTAHIADVFSGETQTLDLGAHVLEGFSPWRSRYVVTQTADRNAALLDANGDVTPHTHASEITSRPMLTRDGRYLAIRTLEADGGHLLILDLADSMLWRSFPLVDPAPDRVFSENDSGLFPQYAAFGQWDAAGRKFLFSDGGAVHVYDAVRGTLAVVIEQAGTPRWVCPAAQ